MNGYGIGTATGGDQQKLHVGRVGPAPSSYDIDRPCVEGRIQNATGRVIEAASRARGAAQLVEAFTGRVLGPPPPVPVGKADAPGHGMAALGELSAAIDELHRGLDWLGHELDRLAAIG